MRRPSGQRGPNLIAEYAREAVALPAIRKLGNVIPRLEHGCHRQKQAGAGFRYLPKPFEDIVTVLIASGNIEHVE